MTENSEKIYLSVVIPAYNEEKRLPKTLTEIDDYLKRQNYNYEIIVVNDGSKDKTSEEVESLKSKIKNLKLIDNKINQGKGAVTRQGMLEARGDYRLFTDADNSTPIKEIEKIWPYFKDGFDVVIGSRDVKGAVLDPPQPLFRRFLGEVFGFFVSLFIGLWEIKDTQCGFKCFKKEVVEKIFPKTKINRFAFDPEILLLAKKNGYKIKEIGIYWKNDPDTKVKPKWIFNMAIDILRIKLNLLRGVYD